MRKLLLFLTRLMLFLHHRVAMEKDLYLCGLLVMVDDTPIPVTVTDIQTVFSHYPYPVLHKEGEFAEYKHNLL